MRTVFDFVDQWSPKSRKLQTESRIGDFSAIVDVFRDPELNGWARALWVIFLVVLPVVGVIVYVIARGRSMSERGRALSQR